jgi:mannosyltransferase
MATAVAHRSRLRRPRIDVASWPRSLIWALGTLGFLALLAVSLWQRTGGLHGSFWMDEGLSVGIASHPFATIPNVLEQDGSPPLFYMLLHVWMSVVGTTEAQTHVLSILTAMLAIPAGLWAGWSLFGPRAGWILAGLCAFNPFLSYYGQETRMYALLATFGLVATTLILQVFVRRRRRLAPVLGVVLAAMLYTHGWGIFFSVGAFAVALMAVRAAEGEERRALLVDGAVTFGVAGVLFLPWLPTLLGQSAHTAAPWSRAPRFGAPIQISRGLMGGDRAAIVLALVGGFGATLLVRGVPREDRQRRAIIALLVLTGVTLGFAWLFSQITPAWTTRYFGVVVGPLLLISAAGFARARGLGLAALAAMAFFWIGPGRMDPGPKSDVRDIAAELAPRLRPGDLLISGQPEQTPALAYYFGPRMRYASPMESRLDPDPWVMDWRDSVDRMKATSPGPAVERLVATLRPGQHVLLVRPLTEGVSNWTEPWTKLVRRRSAQWGEILATDRRLKRVGIAPRYYKFATTVGNSAVLYQKTG